MADESIWNLIGPKGKACSFKMTTDTLTLCKNENNVSGVCEFFSCPLANSKYATIREIKGRLYLFKKEPERMNMPVKQYEKILLDASYDKALVEIEEHLKFWDPALIHKCKQKLGKLTQYLIRKHELSLKQDKVTLVPRRKRVVRIERNRGQKMRERLNIEDEIKKELNIRLEHGLFGEELKEKVESEKEKVQIKNRKRIFIPEFEESDDYVESKKDKSKKKEKMKLKW